MYVSSQFCSSESQSLYLPFVCLGADFFTSLNLDVLICKIGMKMELDRWTSGEKERKWSKLAPISGPDPW